MTKIHRVLAFDQKAFLAPYIEFNTNKRRLARSSFEKDFFKLMTNSVYVKTIEQLRLRTHIKLVSDPRTAKQYIRKPTCQRFQIINNDLVMILIGKKQSRSQNQSSQDRRFSISQKQLFTISIIVTFCRSTRRTVAHCFLQIRTV